MSNIDSGAKADAGQAQFNHSAPRSMHDDAMGQARQTIGQSDHLHSWWIEIIGRVVGILLKWLTFLAVIWSYRVWEPIVCRGMGRRYYAARHVVIAFVVFAVFPLFWLFLAPMLAFFISGLPLVGPMTRPFAHVAPDIGAFLGQKDAVAQVQAAYDTPIGNTVPVVKSDRRVPPSLQRVYAINLLSDPWILEFAKTIRAQGAGPSVNQETALLTRKAVIFLKSFWETVFYFIPVDIGLYLVLVGIYLLCVVRHFRAAPLVEDSRYEGLMLWGEWYALPLGMAVAGFVLALCGLSLVAIFVLCSGLSLAFFRGRLAAKAASLANDKIDQPAASARAQAEKEAAEEIRRETMAEIQKQILEESGKEGVITEDGIEVGRCVAPQMADDEAKEFIRRTLEKLSASDNPVARSAAKKILAAQPSDSKLGDSGDYEGVGVS